MRRVFDTLRRIEAALLAVAMLGIAGVTVVNVVVRNLTGESLAFAEELNQLLIVSICFVGLSYAAGSGRHIRMTAISDALPKRARRVSMIVVSATTCALCLWLAWHALLYARGVDRRTPVLGVPLSTVYLLAPLGLTLAGIQYGFACARNLVDDRVWVAFDRLDGYEDEAEPRPSPPRTKEGEA